MSLSSLSRISVVFLLPVLLIGCAGVQTTSQPTLLNATMPVTATVMPTPQPATTSPAQRPLLMAHVMPWFQTLTVSGAWGWHWTMNHFNPEKQDASGRRQIASHDYPLTGPYDSSDDALLEYQVQLMKLSGIDGVIVDWYGFENFNDFGAINGATRKLFQYVKKAGLHFVICYEDTTIKTMIENGHLGATEAITHGQKVMRYLQDNWFRDDAYLKSAGHPVLLVFGNPPYFKTSADWDKLFSVINPTPLLVTEDDPIQPIAASSYPWPPMSRSGGGELSQSSLDDYLSSFYRKAQDWKYRIAGGFPGFHDIYKEAGVGPGYGTLDARGGATFSATLQRALQSNPDVVQLVTWNDYGEGTAIEPTVESGYRYLEIVQNARRTSGDAAFPFTASDLAIPLQIFNQRTQHKGNSAVNAQLDQAADAILAGKLDDARVILAK